MGEINHLLVDIGYILLIASQVLGFIVIVKEWGDDGFDIFFWPPSQIRFLIKHYRKFVPSAILFVFSMILLYTFKN